MITDILQLQYTGFLTTEQLLFSAAEFPFTNFKMEDSPPILPYGFDIPQNIRLGQRMEVFMAAALSNTRYNLKAKNLQIIAEKQTLGELDFIIENHISKEIIHLEMVYKFYFYRPEIKGSWIDKLVGPNAKDKLRYKLDKLKDHQFPILNTSETKGYLEKLDLSKVRIKQKICFKAQIFVPLGFQITNEIGSVKKCLKGNYFTLRQLEFLEKEPYRYYIPPKNDWVSEPNNVTINLSYLEFYQKISAALKEQRSCMFWILDCNSKLSKRHFATWW